MKPDYKKIRDAVFALCEKNAREVGQLYDDAIMEVAQLMKGLEIDENQPFNFEDYGLQDKVDEIMDRLEASITNKVRDGVIAAYGMSYANCEALIKQAVGEQMAAKVKRAFYPKMRSRDAAETFLKNVPTVSGRLWNGETLALMTSAVEDSIRQGMSASKMATQIKKYLIDPDDWHRRFRYKVGEDDEGNPVYGRKWKKREWDEATQKYHWVDHQPGEPHPGHVGGPGAYRSSYKNALRYARTTTNIAYRTADYNQYQEMPFVIGIEIKLSNNHPVPDICDDLKGVYPKDFCWTGWHPNCRCYQVPILSKKEEVDQMVDAILDGDDPEEVECEGTVTELPENFTKWVKKNEERMMEASERGTLPYFIRDNQQRVEAVLNKPIVPSMGVDVAKETSRTAGTVEKDIHDMFDTSAPGSKEFREKKRERQRQYNGLAADTNYRDVMFNDQNLGLMAIHKTHNFDSAGGDYELHVLEAGYRAGHVVILEAEPGRVIGMRYTEGTWDGLSFEVAGRETATENNILRGLKHCAAKRTTEVAILDFPNGGFDIEIFNKALKRYSGLEKLNDGQFMHFKKIICVQDRRIVYEIDL